MPYRRSLAVLLCSAGALLGSASASPREAVTAEQVTILSPASGAMWSPAKDHWIPGGGNWATDVGRGTTAYARFKNATGTLKLSIVGWYASCGGKAGKQLTVKVVVDGQNVGWVKYAHLDPVKTSGPIANGDKLGTFVDVGAAVYVNGSLCWKGKHVHVEPRNASGYSCYRPISLNAAVSTSTVLGNLGGRYVSGDKKPCPLPNTSITSAPSSPTRSTSAAFKFVSSQPSSKFQCRLDSSSWSGCASPKGYTGVREGTHQFYVRAVSDIGTDSSPATKSWRVDLTAPSAPAGLTSTATEASITLAWAASTDNVGVKGYRVYRDGSLVATATVRSHTFSGLECGTTLTLGVEAFDAVGNTSTRSTTSSSTSACPIFYVVSGSGSRLNPGGIPVEFAFEAIATSSGPSARATGTFSTFGQIRCLNVVGNQASIGGVSAGWRFVFWVEDGRPAPDRMSVIFLHDPAFPWDATFSRFALPAGFPDECPSPPLPEDMPFGARQLVSGDIAIAQR